MGYRHLPWYRRPVLTGLRPNTARMVMVLVGLSTAVVLVMGYLMLVTLLAAAGHP